VRIDFGVVLRLFYDLPLAPAEEVFYYTNRYRLFLVVPQRDLETLFYCMAPEFLKIGLYVLSNDIEGIPDVQPDWLILGGVVYEVFTDELRRPVVVVFIDANRTLGQGDAQA